MKKYLMEGIGAFFLTLAVVMAPAVNNGEQAPLIAGGMLLGMYYAGALVSGAHYNPAISLAALIRGKLDRVDFPYYWLAQFAGSGFAALMAAFLLRCSGNGEIGMRYNDTACALIAEFLGAFMLVFTYLQVHQKRDGEVTGYAGLTTGFVFFAGMSLFGSLSGGYFNPAIALGACVAGLAAWGDILMYIGGSLLGGAAAVSVFRIVNGENA